MSGGRDEGIERKEMTVMQNMKPRTLGPTTLWWEVAEGRLGADTVFSSSLRFSLFLLPVEVIVCGPLNACVRCGDVEKLSRTGCRTLLVYV